MRDQDLKTFSEEVKKGFVDALGNKSSFFNEKKVKKKLKNSCEVEKVCLYLDVIKIKR